MIVALTGATGFVGGHVLSRLIGAGHGVRALTRRAQAERAGVTWIEGALDDDAALDRLCDGSDAVIHVAGVVNGDAAAFDTGNRVGTLAILRAAGPARFIHISSLSAREPQLSLYGASKRAAEDAVMATSRDWIVVRPPAIYGPGDTDNLELFKFAQRGVLPLPPSSRMSVIHVDDLARLIVALVETDTPGSRYEADDGQPGGWSHADYARMIGDAVGRQPLIIKLPKGVLNIGAKLDGLVRGPRAKLTADRVSYMVHPDWVIDAASRPPAELWQPAIATAQGLKDTALWYRAQGWL